MPQHLAERFFKSCWLDTYLEIVKVFRTRAVIYSLVENAWDNLPLISPSCSIPRYQFDSDNGSQDGIYMRICIRSMGAFPGN